MPTTHGSRPASPRSCSTSRRWPTSTCAAAAPARARACCSIPSMTVERIDAIALAGGSAFGLDAAAGVHGPARRAGPRLRDARRRGCRSCRARSCSTCSMAATRTGAAPALSRAWLRGRRGGRRRPSSSAPPAPASAPPPSNFKGGIGSASAIGRRHHRRRPGRGQCGRQRHRRRRPVVLGGAVRAGRRIRRPRLAVADATGRARVPHQGPRRREHHARGGRDRRHPEQGPGQAARDHGAGRHRACDPPGAYPARRRPRVRRRDRRADRCPTRSTAWPSSAAPPPTCSPGRWRGRSIEATALPFPGALPAWRDRFGTIG